MNDISMPVQADVGALDRSTYLGSSDISAILGLSPWKTPVDCYFEKLGMGKPIDAAKEKLFKRGKRLEPIVLDMLAEERGIEFIAKGARYRHPEYPWMAAEIDAEAISPNPTVTAARSASTSLIARPVAVSNSTAAFQSKRSRYVRPSTVNSSSAR